MVKSKFDDIGKIAILEDSRRNKVDKKFIWFDIIAFVHGRGKSDSVITL